MDRQWLLVFQYHMVCVEQPQRQSTPFFFVGCCEAAQKVCSGCIPDIEHRSNRQVEAAEVQADSCCTWAVDAESPDPAVFFQRPCSCIFQPRSTSLSTPNRHGASLNCRSLHPLLPRLPGPVRLWSVADNWLESQSGPISKVHLLAKPERTSSTQDRKGDEREEAVHHSQLVPRWRA